MKIADARRKAGFSTQEQFAAHLGVRRTALAKWEIGMTCPRAPTIKKIAEALNVTSDDVIDAISAAKENAPNGATSEPT